MHSLGFQKFKKIHMIGIGGSGMIGVATILQKSGFKVTGSEGFVAIDKSGGAVKLVDRLEFSMNNFSKDVIKGWER